MTELAGPRLGSLPIDTDISDQSWVCPLSTVHHSCHAAVVSGDPAADKQDPGSGEQGSDLMSAVVFGSVQLPTAPSSTLSLWLTTQNPTFLFVSGGLLLLIWTPPPPPSSRPSSSCAAPIKLVTLVTNYIYILFCSEEARSHHCSPRRAAPCTRVSISGHLRCTSLISSWARVPSPRSASSRFYQNRKNWTVPRHVFPLSYRNVNNFGQCSAPSNWREIECAQCAELVLFCHLELEVDTM